MNIHGVVPFLGEYRPREPVSHNPPEDAVRPPLLPVLGDGAADCLGGDGGAEFQCRLPSCSSVKKQ